MRAIMVMFDSLNRRMLSSYACDWTFTPNFSRLAEKSITFDNCYVGSMPCMPARRELHTGRLNFLHRSWGPIEPFDDSMPEILKSNGIYTHLVSDHQHYWEDGGCTYHNRYSSWEISRGQEGDTWKGEAKDYEPYKGPNLKRFDTINRKYIKEEKDFPQAKTFEMGVEFIETNKDSDNWFLQLETFDPHEPFYCPEQYHNLYPHNYSGEEFDWPPYNKVTESPEKVEHGKLRYASLLSMCDEYLGKVIDVMDEYDMWKDTMLIVNTDHGFFLGEHDYWAKCHMPFYNHVAKIPLFIWNPKLHVKAERRKSLVQTIDLAPTLLDFFDVEVPKDMIGKSLKPVIEKDDPVREACLFGLHGSHINVTDGNYVYMRAPSKENGPLYNYTHMPTHMRARFSIDEMKTLEISEPFSFTKGCKLMKISAELKIASSIPFETMLFDLENDTEQNYPISNNSIEDKMIRHMLELMKENDAPIEMYERMGIEK